MNNLKKLRRQKRLTLDDIQRQTKINRGTYNNYENGTTEPKPETWQALAKFFNVSVEYLQGAYSKKEIAKIVQERRKDDIRQEKGEFFFVFMPVTSETIENYLIAIGVIPYDIPKEKNLLTNEQINNLDFWVENLKLLYNDVAMKWLITKPNLDASSTDVLSAVNSAMQTIINASTTGYRAYDLYDDFIDVYDMEQVVKNHYIKKRDEFLERHKYWDHEEIDEGRWEEFPVYDFKHPHELDNKRHYIDEVQ